MPAGALPGIKSLFGQAASIEKDRGQHSWETLRIKETHRENTPAETQEIAPGEIEDFGGKAPAFTEEGASRESKGRGINPRRFPS